MPQETELKLRLLEPKDASLLQHHALVTQAQAQAPRILRNRYFDTPKLNLLGMGIGLRLREDQGRILQSVKTAGQSVAGLHQRQEWECEIFSDQPQYELLPEWIRLHKLSDPRLMQRLEVCFSTDFERQSWDLYSAEYHIELSLDRGEIRAGTQTLALCEVELELKRGDPAQLYAVALALSDTQPLVIDNRSKAQRGYALVKPQPPVVHKIGDFTLSPQSRAEEAFITLLWHCLGALQANEAAVHQGQDDEGVHQMRVALRHLRSCLSLYQRLIPSSSHALIRTELRWLGTILGAARDLDVLDTQLDSAARQAKSNWIVANLRKQVAQQRQHAYEEVRHSLNSVRYSRLLLRFCQWLSARSWRNEMDSAALERLDATLACDFAAHSLRRQHRRLRRHGQDLHQLEVQARHQVRIESKKLAYGARFFRPLFPSARAQKRATAYLATLSQLRDTLGVLNDSANALSFLDRAPLPPDAPVRYFLQGWCAAQEVYALHALTPLWDSLRHLSPFWQNTDSED
jgi:triphosphatase